MRYWILLLAIVILAGGCTSIREGGLSVALQADPPNVFSKSTTLLHIDLDNRQEKQVNNVDVGLFDAGLLDGRCSQHYDRLLPFEFQTMTCSLIAPQVNNTVGTEVNSRVSFDGLFSSNHVLELMNENEYQRLVTTGEYMQRSQDYIYRDSTVQVEVEFSEPPPLVIRPGKKYFAYFTISNIGNGFISDINPDDFVITSDGILECPPQTMMSPSGTFFPRVACEIYVSPEYLARGARSSDIAITLKYRYELRNSLRIDVIA